MKEIEGNRLSSYKDAPWCKSPKAYQNIVHEDENVIVFKDNFPVTEGHLLFVPKQVTRQLDITRCFELAYKWGVKGVCEYKWDAFNVGINNGKEAGQSVMWPHVHLIPRRKGDVKDPKRVKGGVRHVIPFKGNYDEAQGLTDNEVNYIDEKSVPAPCSRTALVRDRYIDEIKAEKKGKTWKKVDDKKWDKIVQRMKDKEKAQQKLKYDKDNRMV